MFHPPQRIETRVFARLPDSLRLTGKPSAWSFGKGNDNLHSFLEGPAFDRAGNLFLVDIPFGRILRVSPAGEWSVVAEYDGWPNGLAIHKDGRIFVADHLRGIMSVDPASGAVTPVLETVRREGFKGTNDLTFASNGDLYFTDQGQTGLQDPSGRVFRLRADGTVDCLIDNVPSPNGLVLSRDEKSLFLAVTRANQIWRLPLHADGTTTKVGAYITLSGGGGPDGMALDDTGGLAIAHVGLGVIWLFDRLGEPVARVASCEELATTNVAFGGPDGKTLFITESESGTILQADVPQPGRKLYSHM
ncbi:SMP-30/gluconolactonase/LRE family protein [Ancylobacter mangrovi]|uniref:SMP-30/gluconolactonase/LRE family protein n=1 Tax=Ancylobacter mangrovi TaxID=2972472 RepID=UPI0021638887|nr:SMP-30/gluconolactonase/LRE family protein [Ancylobacter mangrovi]MCS0505046.1 SMP-30/gluconolactonase/LRE family protein [Ancylobacter mangrovi]